MNVHERAQRLWTVGELDRRHPVIPLRDAILRRVPIVDQLFHNLLDGVYCLIRKRLLGIH